MLLNLGYRWNLADVSSHLGVVYLPTGNPYHRLQRANRKDTSRVLLDPQLYLSGLDAATCSGATANLASFPWFCVDSIPDFDSSETGMNDWKKAAKDQIVESWPCKAPEGDDIKRAIETAIRVQVEFGCTHIILPSPLIVEREDEAATQAEWLDKSLEVLEEMGSGFGQPTLATVALSENAINDVAFNSAGFLDTIIDQVSSRLSSSDPGISGVYIVIVQNSNGHPFETSNNVTRAYLHLANAFSSQGFEYVFTNFADVAGLVCMGLGATSFATGPSQSLRRLSLSNFQDSGGGRAFPHYYSHKVVGEFLTEADLDVIVSKKLYGRVCDDTTISLPLSKILKKGGSAGELPAWAESQNNITTAHKHFIERLLNAERTASALPSDERSDHIRNWLEDAAANSLYLIDKLLPFEVQGRLAPVENWLETFDQYIG